MKLWIENGLLIQSADAAVTASSRSSASKKFCLVPYNFNFIVHIEYQVYEASGAKGSVSYRGKGLIVQIPAATKNRLLLGDTDNPTSILIEGMVSKQMTKESEVRLRLAEGGILSACQRPKPGNRTAAKGQLWLEAYDAAKYAVKQEIERNK